MSIVPPITDLPRSNDLSCTNAPPTYPPAWGSYLTSHLSPQIIIVETTKSFWTFSSYWDISGMRPAQLNLLIIDPIQQLLLTSLATAVMHTCTASLCLRSTFNPVQVPRPPTHLCRVKLWGHTWHLKSIIVDQNECFVSFSSVWDVDTSTCLQKKIGKRSSKKGLRYQLWVRIL